MERLGDWKTASEYWKKLGEYEQAKACSFLYEAIQKGDAYRERVAELNRWVDETVEAGIMTKEEAVKTVYPQMNEQYNIIYSN